MKSVSLLDGIFKTSKEVGKKYLLYLDEDRLLAPCYEAIGKTPKKKRYGGWEAKQISGHSLGHYMSALAAMYLNGYDEEIAKKINYIVSELAYLQQIDGEGYVSGFSKECFKRVFSGDFTVSRFELGGSWVPWYSIHKIYAGLIDIYEATGNKEALAVVIKLADWAKQGTDKLNEEQFNKMLYCEHGGMCEVFAKLYKITRKSNYLRLAERFIDQEVCEPLAEGVDKLEGMHANTQIPKIIGFAQIYEITGDIRLRKACEFFWRTVTKNRSYAIGGNSIDEHFEKLGTERLGVTTAETCNTYNMLKLTEHLFKWQHKAEYMDFYEKALYNHILASQDPESGMKTYFVSTKPGHFKVYCSPCDSFWCCTGTGMENPGRYINDIYYLDNNDIYVNLFIASKVEIDDGKIQINQTTDFPVKDEVKIVIEETNNENYSLKIRVPYWCDNGLKISINNEICSPNIENGYMTINRCWQKGDIVRIKLSMAVNIYWSKEENGQFAFMYGPIVLAGLLGREEFPVSDIVEDHLVFNQYKDIEVPAIVSNEEDYSELINRCDDNSLEFELSSKNSLNGVKLIPFYDTHHERYTIYWQAINEEEDKLQREQNKNDTKIIIDEVKPYNQQSEIEHEIKYSNSQSDYSSKYSLGWRNVYDDGYITYVMKINKEKKNYLSVTSFKDNDKVNYDISIYVNGFKLDKAKIIKINEATTAMYELAEDILSENGKILIKIISKIGAETPKMCNIKTINY